MSPVVARRRWVGLAALAAPLPLPFNDAVGWPAFLLYIAVAALLVLRAARPDPSWLPAWALNLLGLAYLPVLWLDVATFGRGQPVRPVLHLLLFAVLVKLAGMRKERDLRHVFVASFFVFLAAMATSVHPTVVLYLIGWSAIALMVLARFAWDRVVERFGVAVEERRAAFSGLVSSSLGVAILVAVPLFVLLPRTGEPVVGGPAAFSGSGEAETGLTDVVRLGDISRIRQSRRIAMRIQRLEDGIDPERLRYKARALERYENGLWRTGELRQRGLTAEGGDLYRLRPAPPMSRLAVWLQPQRSTALPLPLGAVQIEIETRGLGLDEGGAVAPFYRRSSPIQYEVGVGERPASLAVPPDPGQAVDAASVTERTRALATRLAGDRPPAEAAETLERWLATQLTYSDQPGLARGDPIDQFLFASRRGHCELFASSLVLMLRSLGIPARLVVGYLGAERNELEDYWVVRDANAHAWVEAWIPGRGWRTFDPTPPAGRPGGRGTAVWERVAQLWDLIVFRWDRWVLGYGLNDQANLAVRLRELWWRTLRLFERPEAGPVPSAAPADEAGSVATEGPREAPSAARWLPIAALALLVVAAAVALLRRRRRLTARTAWVRLLEAGRDAGALLTPATAPAAAGSRIAERTPGSGNALERILDRYLRERFNEEALPPEAIEELGSDLRALSRSLRAAARGR